MEFDHRLVNLEQLRQSIYPHAYSNHKALHYSDRKRAEICRICGLNRFLHPITLKDMRWDDQLPDQFLKGISFLVDHDNGEGETSEEVDIFYVHDHCSKGMI
jgi:hypothetical protein